MSYALVARSYGYGLAFGQDGEDDGTDEENPDDSSSYSNPQSTVPKYTNWGPGEIGTPPPGAYGRQIPLPPPTSPAGQEAAWWGLAALLALPILL